jgi:H2-forming N5,N10-methylenetetrahydromethanopterin dehydrogenase-like enzyme
LRESSDEEEMDEVKARGVRIVNNEVAEGPNSESGVLNEASGQATGQAESTPESTPMSL